MPVIVQYDWKMELVLATLIKFVVADWNTYVNFVIYSDTLTLFAGNSAIYALQNDLFKVSLNKPHPIKIA